MDYKQTPFGKIPQNWDVAPMKEITSVVTDYVANGSFASLAENVQYREAEDYAVLLRLVDYNNNFKGKFVFIDKHAYNFLSKSKLYGGEIIISNVGANVGTVFRCPKLPYRMSLAPNSIMVNFKDGNDFYYYWLKSCYGQGMLQSIVTGSAQPKFNKTNFRDILAPVPPVKTQEKIASILTSIDEKIANNEQINNHLEQAACTIFSDIMAHTSAPLCSLKQLANINPSRKLPKGSCARYIDMSRLSTTGCFPSGWEYKAYNGGMRFTNGDTLLARITPCLENGKTAYVNFLDDQEVSFGSTEYIVISPKDPYPPELFYCLARYPAFVDYAVKNMNGSSGRQRVSAETIGNYKMPALTPDDLMDFCETVPSMFQAIKKGAVENISLIRLRDTLLPRLMSGELDVSAFDL